MNIIDKNSIALKRHILLTLVFITSFVWYVEISEDHGRTMTIAFLDIGQGDAIFIQAPNGNTMIIDGGPSRVLLSALGRMLPFYKRSVNLIVNTNPDSDHYAGFIDLLERYNIGFEMEAGTISKTPTYQRFENSLAEHHVAHLFAKRGMRLVLDTVHQVYLDVLFPDQDVSHLSSNDGSIVMKLTYGNTSVMLQGDATAKVEDHLLALGDKVQADILKAGHHGSRTSTTDEYVKAVAPTYAIISAGLDNSYGHPHIETITTLNKYHVQILKTMDRGTIVFKSDGLYFYPK
jgi:competence protein ComEC